MAAYLPAIDICTNRVDHADPLMAWDARVADLGHRALDGCAIAMTHTAGLHPDQHLVTTGCRQIASSMRNGAPPLRHGHDPHLRQRLNSFDALSGLTGYAPNCGLAAIDPEPSAQATISDGNATLRRYLQAQASALFHC